MNLDRLVDKLLETENLTDNLEDDEANLLIDWAVEQVPGLAQDAQDEAQAGERVNALMRFMRAVNKLAPAPEEITPDGLLDLLERYARVFGAARAAGEGVCEEAAAQVSQMSAGEAVQFLLAWVLPVD